MIIRIFRNFAIAFISSVGVTYLWHIFFHEITMKDWDTSYRLGVIIGLSLSIYEIRKKMKSMKYYTLQYREDESDE